MSDSFKILDCTLRDGGYYTNWDFDEPFVAKYLDTMRALAVDVVEVGYRSPQKPEYLGRYFYLDKEDVQQMRSRLGKDQKLAIMLNAKDLAPGVTTTLLEDMQGVVDIVRFACPPNEIEDCLVFASEVRALGIDCALNIMYLNEWIGTPEVLEALITAGDVVSTVSLVDSYGACYPKDVERAVANAVAMLPQEIGFHGHDNIRLAFANALAALQGGATILDSTVLGMGRGAGNLQTELIYSYVFTEDDTSHAPFRQLAEFVSDMEKLQAVYGWGTNMAYQIAGFSGLKQAQVMDWLSKRRYDPSSIVAALRNQTGLSLDHAVYPDISELKHERSNVGTMVVLGGGPSVQRHSAALRRFVERTGAIVVHAGLKQSAVLPECSGQLFCLSGHEASGHRAAPVTGDTVGAWIVPSPPRFQNSTPAEGRILQIDSDQTSGEHLGPISDIAPLQMALAVARELACERVYLLGFDGYEKPTNAEASLMRDVQLSIDNFTRQYPGVELKSLTPTQYSIATSSIYANA